MWRWYLLVISIFCKATMSMIVWCQSHLDTAVPNAICSEAPILCFPVLLCQVRYLKAFKNLFQVCKLRPGRWCQEPFIMVTQKVQHHRTAGQKRGLQYVREKSFTRLKLQRVNPLVLFVGHVTNKKLKNISSSFCKGIRGTGVLLSLLFLEVCSVF